MTLPNNDLKSIMSTKIWLSHHLVSNHMDEATFILDMESKRDHEKETFYILTRVICGKVLEASNM